MTTQHGQTNRDDLVTWIRENARPISAAADLDADLDDLEPFAAMVGDAKIVGLGESWHCISEFLADRFRLARFLVERLGFTGIILEGVIASSQAIDDYVRGGPGQAGDLLASNVIWDNLETVRFLEWLRSHNGKTSAAQQVRVFGIESTIFMQEDELGPGAPPRLVIDYLVKVDPDYVFPHLADVQRIVANFPPGDFRAHFGYLSTLPAEDQQAWDDAFAAVAVRLLENRGAYVAASSATEFEWALHRAMVVRQTLAIHTATVSSFVGGMQVRERSMAENASWAMQQMDPDGRFVVLGHTAHLAKQIWIRPEDPTGIVTMGCHLAQWLPDEYRTLTTAFGHGVLDSPHPVSGAFGELPQAPDSIDAAFAQAGSGSRLLAIPAGSQRPTWALRTQPLRTMNQLGWSIDYGFGQALDYLLYVDEIHEQTPRT